MKDKRFKINSRLKIKDLRFRIKDFSYFLILISLILILAPTAHVQQSADFPRQTLSISPIISELRIHPGRVTSYDLKIQNLADTPIGIHAQVSDLEEPESQIANGESSPLIKWTKLSENDFIIGARGEKTVTVSINPPKDLKEGGFYEAIYLTPFISGQNQTQKPVVLSRIGALVFATNGEINYKNLKDKVSVNVFKSSEFFLTDKEFVLDLLVENKYFTHFSAKPAVTVTQIFGKPYKLEIEEKKVLPGRERVWEISGSVGGYGIYKANLALSVGNGEQIFSETWFVYLPITVILISIAILLIIVFIISRKKRLKKALKILKGKA